MKILLKIGYVALPVALLVHLLSKYAGEGVRHWEPLVTFALSGIAIIPLAHLMGEATGQLSVRTGPTLGGLLNATFGNAAELIIAVIAMTKGLNDVVKASLTGSILGNLLLVSGGAMLVGGWKRERQVFSKEGAQTNSAMLVVAVVAMLFPAVFDFANHDMNKPLLKHQEEAISIGASVVVLAVYVMGLVFTLRTHRHVFSSGPGESPEGPAGIAGEEHWSVRRSVLSLLLASVLTAVVAELLVGSVEQVGESLHWNPIFVGVILLAIFGNAAEQSTAVILAKKGDMETAMTITYQSSLQIALFTTPFLVLLSAVLTGVGVVKHPPLDLFFSPIEVAAVFLSVAIITVVALNGETNWFEGAMLLAVYAILGIVMFHMPNREGGGYHGGEPGSGGKVVEVAR